MSPVNVSKVTEAERRHAKQVGKKHAVTFELSLNTGLEKKKKINDFFQNKKSLGNDCLEKKRAFLMLLGTDFSV